MKYLLPLLALILLSGCTQAQVDRAEASVKQSRELLQRAEAAESRAKEAVAMARKLADTINNDKAKEIVEKAEAAMATVSDSVATARGIVEKSETTLAAVKNAHAAGGSTLDVLLAGISVFVPTAGAALIAIRKAMTNGRALRQTVTGLDDVRKVIGDTQWDASVAPALESSQDAATKVAIKQIQATA